MIKKEQLLSVPDLKLAGRIENMPDAQFDKYVRSLNSLVDNFPAQAEKLRNSLSIKAYAMLAANLSEICGALDKIHADDMARECRVQVNVINSNAKSNSVNHNALEAFIENFIQSVSNLSVNIQMAAAKSAGKDSSRASSASGKPLILAVDNAVMFLNTLKRLLANQPYDLHCVTTCSEALDFVRKSKPNIILLDIEMPEMSGYELAKKIREAWITAPIIFITANSEREYVDKAIKAGAAGLLMKPLRIAQLLGKLKELI